MPNTYEIKFENKHGSDGNYCFCTEEPIVNSKLDDPNVIVNAWITTFVPDGGSSTTTMTNQYYAFSVKVRTQLRALNTSWGLGCGKLPSEPILGTIASNGHAEPVTIGATDIKGDTPKMVVKEGSPTLEKPFAKTAFSGCYSILQGLDFQKDDNIVIGLGQVDNKGNVAPAVTIPADQNMTTNIQPIIKFYIKEIEMKRGAIVNWQSFSAESGVIDFSSGPGQGRHTANVFHNSIGAFIVEYK